jgi:hypothetical protein
MARLAALLMLAPLAGCYLSRSTTNEPIEPQRVARLVPGETTQAQALELLGAPTEVVQLGRRSAWGYDHALQKQAGLWLLVVGLLNTDTQQDRVWLFFEEDGRLAAAGATLSASSAVYELPWSRTHERKR